MELVLIWIALAVVVGLFAGKRGRGSGTWALVALLISPLIAWLLLLVLRDLSATADQPSPQTHVRCPDCRELVRKDARKCKHCGTVLVPQD